MSAILLCSRFIHRRSDRATQLDIFEDSRDVMLRNDVLQALQRLDAVAARQVLAQEYPVDAALAPLAVLCDALEQAQTSAPSTDLDALCRPTGARRAMPSRWHAHPIRIRCAA